MLIVLKKLLYFIFFFLDNIIKVWRLYFFVEEVLVSLMSFYCVYILVYMIMLKINLCVVFQDYVIVIYNIVIYNFKDRSKFGCL